MSRLICWVAAIFLVCAATRAQTTQPALPPVSGQYFPAEIFWGAYRNNDKLTDDPDGWQFVRQHADGLLLHFGFWLNNDYKGDPVGVGKKLAALMKPGNKRFLMEIGWPSRSVKPELVRDFGNRYAKEFSRKVKQFQSDTGVRISEFACELRLFVFEQTVGEFPDFSMDDLMAQVTGDRRNYPVAGRAGKGYWTEFLSLMHAELGDVPIHVGWPPIYMPWHGLWAAGTDMQFSRPARTNGGVKPPAEAAQFVVDGQRLVDSLLQSDTAGFTCDSPWFLMSNPEYVRRGYFVKLRELEQFVRARGRRFTFIVNSSPDKKLDHEAWDKYYAETSLKSLQLFQTIGGRADRYLLESWYDGPFRMTPETERYTMTWMVRQAILYLQGPGQKLAMSFEGQRLSVTNQGEVACLPALRFSGDARVSIDGLDQTRLLRSEEGWTVPELIEPGATVSFVVKASGEGRMDAIWNPQSRDRTPRAACAIR